MIDQKFRVGHVYYQIHGWAEPKRSTVISSWVYEGVVEVCSPDGDACSSHHRFIEWESWLNRQRSEGQDAATVVCYGSLETADQCMRTWDELLPQVCLWASLKWAGRRPTRQLAADVVAEVSIGRHMGHSREAYFCYSRPTNHGTPTPGMFAFVALGPSMRFSVR